MRKLNRGLIPTSWKALPKAQSFGRGGYCKYFWTSQKYHPVLLTLLKGFSDFVNFKNLFFRDKNLSFDGNGIIYFNPYFKIDLSSSIENINTQFLKKIKLNEFLYSKSIIRKINFKNNLIFKPNKFNINLI